MNWCCKRPASSESINAVVDGAALYRCKNYGVIREGYAFSIDGKIPAEGDFFMIDFNTNNMCRDVAIRIIFRASTNSVTRNSCVYYNWGEEETSLANPFHLVLSKDFVVEVFFSEEDIFIAFDGIHIAKYKQRVDYLDIHDIEIRGDITDICVEHGFISDYPTHIGITPRISYLCDHLVNSNELYPIEPYEGAAESEERQFLPLPYYAMFKQGFLKLDYVVNVKGRVGPSPNMIKVVLQEGESVWPPPNIGVQMEFRFNEKRDGESNAPVIVFNSFRKSEWAGEVKPEVAIDLKPGSDFNLMIVRGRLCYEVHLNNKHIHDYRYLINPRYVNTCSVRGDIQLIDVIIESS